MSVLNRIARFAKRPARDQLFVLASLVVVAGVRLCLDTLGYRRLRRLLPSEYPLPQRVTTETPPSSTAPMPRDLARAAWAVSLAARYVPRASCLTQALAGQVLLGRCGIPSTIRIGARTTDQGAFAAHAWLLSGDRIVLGGTSEDVSRFAPLVDLDPGGRSSGVLERG